MPASLTPCPSTPNCVSSRSRDPRHAMAPIFFVGPAAGAQETLRRVLGGLPRAAITADRPGYLAVSFRSRVFHFVDEAEFVFDGEEGVIHFRSAARSGYYDFGVNRSRMESIARAFREARARRERLANAAGQEDPAWTRRQ
jgi:uncharacterized protein (DUF1499 family)